MELTIKINVSGAELDLDTLADDADVDLTEIQDDDDKIAAATEVISYNVGGEVDDVKDIVLTALGLDHTISVEIEDVQLVDVTFEQEEEIKFEGGE